MLCRKCGKEIPDGSILCPRCGVPQTVRSAGPEPAGRSICPTCGALVREGRIRCPTCGKLLRPPEPVEDDEDEDEEDEDGYEDEYEDDGYGEYEAYGEYDYEESSGGTGMIAMAIAIGLVAMFVAGIFIGSILFGRTVPQQPYGKQEAPSPSVTLVIEGE